MSALPENLGAVQLLVFAFFAIVAVVVTIGCFSELFDLLNRGALDQTVRTLLTK